MNHLEPPPTLKLQTNKAEDWKKWKQRWENYYKASGLRTKEAEVQTATLLHVIGEEGLDIYNSFVWEAEGDQDNLEIILGRFETYCNPRKNLTIERHAFNTRVQLQGESVEDFFKLYRNKQETEFGELNESLIKDRLVAGIENNNLRMRLLEKTDLTLEGALQIIKAAESSRAQAKAFMKPNLGEELEVEAIKVRPQVGGNFHKYKGKSERVCDKQPRPKSDTEQAKKYPVGTSMIDCSYCGRKHPPRKCFAYGQTCFTCQGRNHFSRMCRSRKSKQRHVAEIQQGIEDESSDKTLFVGKLDMINQSDNNEKDWIEVITINNIPVKFKLDTGAQCNILPKAVLNKVTNKPMESTRICLKSYTNQKVTPIGQIELWCTRKDKKYKIRFQVIEGDFAAIIGKDDCVNMNIVQRVVSEVQAADLNHDNIVRMYVDVFEGLGELPGEYHMKLNPEVPPVIHAPRRVPIAYEKELQKELEKMENDGIIEKVPNNEPAEWVSSLVVVTKPNGGLRVCLDPKDLNRAIKREHHPLRTVDEVAARVSGAKVFSILDAEKAFYQILLDEESSKLLTFNTPFGRYRYLRMPMGIISASEIFQRRAEKVFEGLEGVETSIDDSLVWGANEQEHDERLVKALERARENKMKLNIKKCHSMKECLSFLGNKFTAKGLQPDERHCTAIREMKVPEDREAIQRFLGMVNYVGKYIPNMSQMTAPLRELLKKDVVWHWTPELSKCFDDLKETMVNPPVLQYYNPKQELTLQVDASSKGVGACLIQGGKPVAYASRTLTKAQENYSPIEKEMLGILFGCTRFNEYISGRETLVETDHKPLESIVSKPLHMAPLRLQRMMFQLQRFPGITVKYKKGKEMFFADTLSRAYVNDFLEETHELDIDLISELPITEEKLKEFVKLTKEDAVLF